MPFIKPFANFWATVLLEGWVAPAYMWREEGVIDQSPGLDLACGIQLGREISFWRHYGNKGKL